jgi:hypothetical protein
MLVELKASANVRRKLVGGLRAGVVVAEAPQRGPDV